MKSLFKGLTSAISKIWESEWFVSMGAWFVAASEFRAGAMMSGVGWTFFGLMWWAYCKEQRFYNGLFSLYDKHLVLCRKRDEELLDLKERLRKYESEGDEDAAPEGKVEG